MLQIQEVVERHDRLSDAEIQLVEEEKIEKEGKKKKVKRSK